MTSRGTDVEINRRVWEKAAGVSDLRESRLRRVAEVVAALPPGKLLDVGCGRGAFGSFVRKQLGWEVHGVELIDDFVAEAAKRLHSAQAVAISEAPLPFPSDSFDLVFAGEIIEHLVDTDAFLAEIARVTQPGGTVIVTTPNLASFENRLRILLGLYPIWVDYRAGGEGHVRAYTPRVLKRQLRAHGLEPLRHLGNWVPFLPQRFADDLRHPWLSVTGKWLPSLAMDIIIVARKRGVAR
ncbi:MAG: class I SAM-dependent methyltransferase [Acidimicrobiia bacterium]